MLTASICTIGDEILIGQIVDTNSSLIAKELNKCGIKVNKMISIQDDESEIVSSLEECSHINDILIVTGGLLILVGLTFFFSPALMKAGIFPKKPSNPVEIN